MRHILAALATAVAVVLLGQSIPLLAQTDEPAASATNEAGNSSPANDTPSELWVRIIGVNIGEDSPLRNDGSFNDPPHIYVVFKKNGETLQRSSRQAGWSATFPYDLDHETVVRDDDNDEYSIEVWDSQWRRDQLLFKIGPFKGSQWPAELIDPSTSRFDEERIVTLKAEDEHATISLSYAGTRIWYRLVNVTIPPDSPHRKDRKLTHPPRLQITLQSDGVRYGYTSTRQTGWAADFPKTARHCWAVREGTRRRYTVEVWDNQKFGWQSIFSVAGLSAEDFRKPIIEDVGQMVEWDRAATVTFERIPQSF